MATKASYMTLLVSYMTLFVSYMTLFVSYRQLPSQRAVADLFQDSRLTSGLIPDLFQELKLIPIEDIGGGLQSPAAAVAAASLSGGGALYQGPSGEEPPADAAHVHALTAQVTRRLYREKSV